MMELNHLGCGIGISIFPTLQKLYLVNGMNISAVINNTTNHIMPKQIASVVSLCGEYVLTRTTCVLAMLAASIRDNYHALIMLVGLEEKEKPDKNLLL